LKRALTVLLAAIAAVFLAVPASADTPRAITLPTLSGRYPVGTVDLHLVDPARRDPWKPAQQRELMVTVSYPAAHSGSGQRAPWMQPGVAAVVDAVISSPDYLDIPTGSVDWAGVQRRARVDVPLSRAHRAWPVVLFSPGASAPREINATLTDDLASHGYVVVSISNTYEAAAVQFPDGRVETALAGGDPAAVRTAIDTRIADNEFVLDQLRRLNHGHNPDADGRSLPAGIVGALDLSKVGIAGHSYGGYVAGETMFLDRNIDAGVNLDGAMSHSFGAAAGIPENAVKYGVHRPFLLMGADEYDPATDTWAEHTHRNADLDPSWGQFWAHQRAWKRDLHLSGGVHYGFTDLQVVVPQLSTLLSTAKRLEIIGRINPAESLAIQHHYLAGYFDQWLKGRNRGLFDADSPRFPDARFVH